MHIFIYFVCGGTSWIVIHNNFRNPDRDHLRIFASSLIRIIIPILWSGVWRLAGGSVCQVRGTLQHCEEHTARDTNQHHLRPINANTHKHAEHKNKQIRRKHRTQKYAQTENTQRHTNRKHTNRNIQTKTMKFIEWTIYTFSNQLRSSEKPIFITINTISIISWRKNTNPGFGERRCIDGLMIPSVEFSK